MRKNTDMQETRQQILDILREKGPSTVDEIVGALRDRRGVITAVTVRHHLNTLQKEDLITAPELLHRNGPGRPQHVYTLTDKAEALFPNNYKKMAQVLLRQIEQHLPAEGINVILEGVAVAMAEQAEIKEGSLQERVSAAVEYLNEHGYNASWEACEQGFIVKTCNCPYHQVAHNTDSLCSIDMRLISRMIGIVPRLLSRVAEGDTSCRYLIPTFDN